jgi:hypothetical protein
MLATKSELETAKLPALKTAYQGLSRKQAIAHDATIHFAVVHSSPIRSSSNARKAQ